MSLRTRLWLVLGGLFLVPILLGALVIGFVVPGVQEDRVVDSLDAAVGTVQTELDNECTLLGATVRAVALEAGVTDPETAVNNAADQPYIGYAAVLDPAGVPVKAAGELPPGAGSPADLVPCTDTGDVGAVLAQQVVVRNVPGADRAVVARPLDPQLLGDMLRRGSLGEGELVLLRGMGAEAEVVATTADDETTGALTRTARRAERTDTNAPSEATEVNGWLAIVQPAGPTASYTIAVAAEAPQLVTGSSVLLAAVLVGGVLLAGVLVLSVARQLSQPFADLTAAAVRVAEGDYDASIAGPQEGEAARLSDAFNTMTLKLRRNMTALEQSREDLRDSLERIGDALVNTHDLVGLLDVVLETAVVTLQARAGVLLWGAPDQIAVVAEHGLDQAGLSAPTDVELGKGVLGRVLATGESVHGLLSSGPPELHPSATEPREGDVLAVPLRSMGSVVGVIALYGRTTQAPFGTAEDDALRTLAGQASTAVDNVQLHQEAERLSTTDGLTGLWNFRYLSMSLAREIERSSRFDRPLAVLMLDLDHFKQVNDRFGHAAGDAVLRELAHRVQEQIREVDTFARYGGEEFVVVLPETTIEGATQLAERICNAVRREAFETDDSQSIKITVSVGGAAFPVHGSSAATLMRAADRALYIAKNEGRDRWHVPDS